ncbi:serine/threonine-protein kinase [Archangium primigenium]|uniref:serine/threonine-protein kinase n=1 Tax=[Archangium] primigenium TaxID=2792470 RepID=UPI0019599197|nr:serine/threonine-protein kinase [Archangium primigenium]MBM7114029.1 serine/threonine protein kinase [Archangium primigenium]
MNEAGQPHGAPRRWRTERPPPGLEDATPPALGEHVDGYRLEARLGAGGQGTVYRARRAGRLYALKFLPLARGGWPWRELEVGLRLRRLGSACVLGHGQWPADHPTHLFLVLPYVRGRPLEAWAREENPSARAVARVMRELARQVRYIHRAGVVHRDVKASNVLVRDVDGGAVLVDFGVGTYLGAPHITHPLALPGTPYYRSPEALRFRREHVGEFSPARPSDDLWALGVLLYWLLTHSYPFEPRSALEDEGGLADRILQETPEPPHVRNPRAPRALGELCLRLLDKALDARLPDAGALDTALEALERAADPTWDAPLCQPWSPDTATTPQDGPLTPGDRRDKALRLRDYARRHARRGAPRPREEASTDAGGHEAPPPARRITRPVLLGMGLMLLLLALTVLVSTSEVTTSSEPPEGHPTHSAHAAPTQDNMLMKTFRLTQACISAWALGQLACATPQAARPVLPPEEECPPEAWLYMREWGVGPGGKYLATFPNESHVAPVVVQPDAPLAALEAWGEHLPQETVFTGRLYFSEDRAYGRYTRAQTPDGKVYPVCMEIWDQVPFRRGMPIEAGSKPGAIKIVSTVYLMAVARFDEYTAHRD